MKYTNELIRVGLTREQALIYEILLDSPLLPVRTISKNAGVGRELTYYVLDQLSALDMCEKVENIGKVALWRAKHPESIKKVAEEKKTVAEEANIAYGKVIEHLVSDFNSLHSRPHVKFFEGFDGLNETYADILKNTKEVFVFRSLYDHENSELRALVSEQLKKQSSAGIRSYVLTPKLEHMSSTVYSHDMARNITRKIIPKDKFVLPAYILIYKGKVSITSVKNKDSMVTTLIENSDIADTFLTLFQFMWDSIE